MAVVTKCCSTCKLDKDILLFTKDKSKRDGYYSKCKECCRKKIKDFYINHPGYKKKIDKEYYSKNKSIIIKRINYYISQKYKTDVQYKLKKNISGRVASVLRKKSFSKNGKSILQYLPYSMLEFKKHLEAQFESWMNWNNYGKFNSKTWDDNDSSTWTWQIDHVVPHSNFQYNSMIDEAFQKCWALDNLRPLSAKQNFTDGILRVRHIK